MAMSELKQKLLLFEMSRLGFPSAAYDPEYDRIKVQTGRSVPMLIADSGEIFYTRDERDMVRDTVIPVVTRVNDSVAAWENARSLADMDLPEYRVLAEYGNTVLAARDDTDLGHGFHYVTWECDRNRTGMRYGHYTEDVAAAKEDFAVRAGLVREEKVLTSEQAAVLRAAVAYRIENDYDILPAAAKDLEAVAAKLDMVYPSPAVREQAAPEQDMAEQDMAEQDVADGPEQSLRMG